MAAAALGQAARRLGGSALRQAQAAGTLSKLSPAQPRLLPKLMHTEAEAGSSCARQRGDGHLLLDKIQRRKEVLYDLMTEAHKRYGSAGWDARLFQRLSDHVKPRPHDPTWEWNQSSKRVYDFNRNLGVVLSVFGCFMLMFVTSVDMSVRSRSSERKRSAGFLS